MLGIRNLCTPIIVYLVIAGIISLVGLALGIMFKGLFQSLVNLLINIGIMIICSIILYLICRFAGPIFSWIIVIIIAILQLLAIAGFMSQTFV